ncbi:hypothetical protein [Burkholderia pseudomallei]|uniref:hypothetical protein n=1 Tax=Burkholderia pseudomallei TaxID=28450 RepID=UPI0022D2C462|nr:hypothetical protein [Burkholderia pseudomallei]MDA0561696.1 hypothetical protein [Burkholderia pseudomallei]
MQNWELISISCGDRLIKAKYRQGRLSGFITSVQKDDNVTCLRFRERLANLLVGLAGFLNQRDMNIPTVSVQVINPHSVGESGSGAKNDREGSSIDVARESVSIGAKDASTTDVHFDLDLLGGFVKQGRKITFHFPS